MNAKSIKLILLTLSVYLLLGCQPKSSSGPVGISQPLSPNGSSAPQTPPAAQGTSTQGGGGNTLLGKPLESYIINPRELEAFKATVGPILDSAGLRRTRLKQALDYVLNNKVWYFVPVELSKLPDDKIGSAVGTEQTAIQDFKQVWIYKHGFDEMGPQDRQLEQAKLLIHEILMGVRLLKFDSALNECLAFDGPNSETMCKNSYSGNLRGIPSDLTSVDYAEIRSTAGRVFQEGLKLSEAGWQEILGQNGFSTRNHHFITNSEKKTMSIMDLAKMIDKSRKVKSFPRFGFDFSKLLQVHPELPTPNSKSKEMTWISDSICDYDFSITESSIEISIVLDGQKKVFFTPWTSTFDGLLEYDSFVGLSYLTVSVPPLHPKELADNINERPVLFLELGFSNDYLQVIRAESAVCLNENCTEMGAAGNSDKKLICYPQKTLNFTVEK